MFRLLLLSAMIVVACTEPSPKANGAEPTPSATPSATPTPTARSTGTAGDRFVDPNRLSPPWPRISAPMSKAGAVGISFSQLEFEPPKVDVVTTETLPESVRVLVGKKIRVWGYIGAEDLQFVEVNEFTLTGHGIRVRPGPGLMLGTTVGVEMVGGRMIKDTHDPILVEGLLTLRPDPHYPDNTKRRQLYIAADSAEVPERERPRTRRLKAPESTNEAYGITFDHLDFQLPRDDDHAEAKLPPNVRKLLGKKVRLRGYFWPAVPYEKGIKQFIVVRDDMPMSFGPGFRPCDNVIVEMKAGPGVDFTTRPITVEGVLTFRADRVLPTEPVTSVFHITADSAAP